MTTQNEVPKPQLARVLNAACGAPREPLRALALSMVSHQTLLRGPGPLGFWSHDPKERQAKARENDVQRQRAIITNGLLLGIDVKLVVR